jgi:multiple sugar transport system ATP-binding protein
MNFMDAVLADEQGAYFVRSDHFNVRLPEAFHGRVAAYAGRPVIFGVRPEDMAEATEDQDFGAEDRLAARVEVVETLGAETFVHLTCGTQTLVARVAVPDRPLTVGQTMQVQLKMEKTHLFDHETSRTIV